MRRYLSDIDKTFILFVLGCLFAVSSVFVVGGILHHSRTFDQEVAQFLRTQVVSTIVNLQHERRTGDFYRIKKIIAGLPNIESIAIYDKNCQQLTESFLPIYPENSCPTDTTVQVVTYPDVVSSIGSIAFKIKRSSFNIWDYSRVILLALAFASICCLILTVLWRKLIYKPLVTEIDGLASGQMPKLRQLGGLGIKVEKLIRSTTEYELNLERVKDSETKARKALKVAHDILNPVFLLKSELNGLNRPEITDALLSIESIAYDLLPEKAPIAFSNVDTGDLTASLLSQAKLLSTPVVLSTNSSIDLPVFTSKSHFLRVAMNLLKNACEASPEGSVVEIGFFKLSGTVEFRIIDLGSGFDGMAISSTKASGSGLGLESTREILKQLGGNVTFSKNPTQGTTTTVTLPLAQAISHDQDVWLIEDDKYVRSQWRATAAKASIQLKIFDSLPEDFPEKGTVVYLDRFLGEVDSSDWASMASAAGAKVHSISALGAASKTPPWSTPQANTSHL
ncbi:MAG: HAMP domain-containing histidine kinase [Proteobacteria bacterium]|nr:HAMP domain-containing histidine kinase [Pseudomonadota bacterium]